MKNLPLLIGTIVISIVMIVGVAFMFSGDSSQTGEPVNVPASELVTANPHVKGATESAQVTVVEFSDFQCPACRAAAPLVEQVAATYPEQVEIIYRHFPLDSIHPNARNAAAASEVAAEYGKFWEYHDVLFANQDLWADISSRDELYNTFAEYAAQLEIDKNEFLEKIESDQVKAAVQEDASTATRLGVNATPTFFVNGQQTSAPQLMSTVESLISESSEDVEE